MKRIPSFYTMMVSPTTPEMERTAQVAFHDFQPNRIAVIMAAAAIEDQMMFVVENFLFRNQPHDAPEREFLKSQILASDWCSYAQKVKVILALMQGLYTGKEIDAMGKTLRALMRLRNAFTHGVFCALEGKPPELRYFEGGPKTQAITDEWLDEVTQTIETAKLELGKVHAKVRALWPPPEPPPPA